MSKIFAIMKTKLQLVLGKNNLEQIEWIYRKWMSAKFWIEINTRQVKSTRKCIDIDFERVFIALQW